MSNFYSAATGGFYDTRVNERIPDDAIELSDSEYAELFAGQAAGLLIGAADDGRPTLNEPPAPTTEQVAAAAIKRRDVLLTAAALAIAPLQDAVDLGEATADEVAALTAWKQCRIALGRIEQQPGYPTTIEWPVSPATTEGATA